MAFAETQIRKGLKKQARGDAVGALGHYRAVLSRKPRHAHALYFAALACQQLKKYDDAIHAMQAVVQLKPSHADAWYNLGKFFQDTRRPEKALEHYVAALEQDPDHIEALTNAGNIYLEFGEGKFAELCYHRALAQDPQRPEAKYNRAFVRLARGDYTEGWADHEARWQCAGHIAEHWRPEFMDTTPKWDGSPIPGKTLLLHWEQGLGDTIQFVRYVHAAAERSLASVVLEVQQPLLRLIRDSFPNITVMGWGEALPKCDAYASLMSLPHLCGMPEPEYRSYLKARHGTRYTPTFNVGICWAGSKGHLNDHNRSMTLRTLAPVLSVYGVNFISLQIGDRADEADDSLPLSCVHPTRIDGAIEDFSSSAMVVNTLDLVITVDTSTAHLAGALGVDTWLMLPTCPDFRWMNEGSTTSWYPSMTLYRQQTRGDWTPVVDRIASDLRAHLNG